MRINQFSLPRGRNSVKFKSAAAKHVRKTLAKLSGINSGYEVGSCKVNSLDITVYMSRLYASYNSGHGVLSCDLHFHYKDSPVILGNGKALSDTIRQTISMEELNPTEWADSLRTLLGSTSAKAVMGRRKLSIVVNSKSPSFNPLHVANSIIPIDGLLLGVVIRKLHRDIAKVVELCITNQPYKVGERYLTLVGASVKQVEIVNEVKPKDSEKPSKKETEGYKRPKQLYSEPSGGV